MGRRHFQHHPNYPQQRIGGSATPSTTPKTVGPTITGLTMICGRVLPRRETHTGTRPTPRSPHTGRATVAHGAREKSEAETFDATRRFAGTREDMGDTSDVDDLNKEKGIASE